jgi:ribosomal-protein-alanine N-acetyltransferase
MMASPAGTLRIRPMQVTDVERVHEIDMGAFALPWPVNSYLFEIERNKAGYCWVAEIGEPGGEPQIVGMLVIWLLVDTAHVATIAVDADYHRQGIARRMLLHGLTETAKHGAIEATLEVRVGNQAAQTLYRQFGFEVVGERRSFYSDNGEDALIMTMTGMTLDRLETFSITLGAD